MAGFRPLLLIYSLIILFCNFGCSGKDTTSSTKIEKKNNFRAKFNNETVEKKIQDFQYWDEIQSEEVDLAFEAYQRGSYVQGRFPKEAAIIFGLIDRGGLLGVVVEAHEKWEVLEYLKKGYSIEDIGNGKAYEEYKPQAHAVARFKELRFYQFWYKHLFKDKPPAMKAFLFVHPVLKMIVQDVYKVEIDTKLMDRLVNELQIYKDTFDSEECSEKDLERCLIFFEKTGYDYGDQRGLFLSRASDFLNKFN